MSMKLLLEDLRFDCIIGELPDERVRLQSLRIDAELTVPDTAGETDELADTVDYAALAQTIVASLREARPRTLERAARLAGALALAHPQTLHVRVKAVKFGAVPNLKSAAAVWEGDSGHAADS